MNRLGWGFLAIVVICGALFASMLRFGRPDNPAQAPASGDEGARDRGVPIATGYPALAVPVAGVRRDQISDNWLDPRDGGARQHHGTDIMVPGGTPIIAAAPGRIEKLFKSKLGGTTLYERSPDGRWQYYYAHMSGYARGVHEGEVVKTGDQLGYAGDTGDAGPGNTQLHFGLSYMRPGEGWWQGTPVNPYPLLAGKPVGG